MPKPGPDAVTNGQQKRPSRSSRFTARWTRLYDFAWSPTFWGGDGATPMRPRNLAARTAPVYTSTLENTFNVGLDHAFVTDQHGSGLAFNGSATSYLRLTSPAWLPLAAGGFQAATLFALFKRTGAYVTNSRAFPYVAVRYNTNNLCPSITLRASANCGAAIQMSSGGSVAALTMTGFSAEIGDLICLALTTRSTTDHEVVGYNFTTGQFARATDTTNVGNASVECDSEIIAGLSPQAGYGFNDQLVGNVYLAGFAPSGFSSAELAEIVNDPWTLFQPEFPPLITQLAQVQSGARSRVIWM